MRIKRGQSTIEFTVLVMIIILAFVFTGDYLRRGIQGRWRQAVDGLGEQYDPIVMQTDLRYFLESESETNIKTDGNADGYWSNRYDDANSMERKTGFSQVGSY